jgi:hypothetical protein
LTAQDDTTSEQLLYLTQADLEEYHKEESDLTTVNPKAYSLSDAIKMLREPEKTHEVLRLQHWCTIFLTHDI